MKLKTTIFDLYKAKYRSITELAIAMDLSISYVYRVREGSRQINQKFILGALQAFPDSKFEDLFYIDHE